MTIAALIINVFPLFKVTNFCQVDFAIGCWIYSILCECGIIASNFVFNIRFMQRISPLNLLDSLLNLIYQVFKFSTQLWKSLLVWEWQHISANISSHLFLCCLYFEFFAGWCQFVAADCDRHCVLEVGEGGDQLPAVKEFNLQSITSPTPPRIYLISTLKHPLEYILYQLSRNPHNPKPWPNHFSLHSGGLSSI